MKRMSKLGSQFKAPYKRPRAFMIRGRILPVQQRLESGQSLRFQPLKPCHDFNSAKQYFALLRSVFRCESCEVGVKQRIQLRAQSRNCIIYVHGGLRLVDRSSCASI